MPYIFLKNIIESVVANYVCPDCWAKAGLEHLNITGMSSRGVDIHINCSVCGAHSHLSAEVNTMASEMLSGPDGAKFFEEFIKNWGTLGATMNNKKNNGYKWINAEDIAKVDEDLKNAKSVEDLMK